MAKEIKKKKMDEYFDKVIPLKEQYDKDKNNTEILNQIISLFASYNKNVMCITGSAMLRMIDNEIKERKARSQKIKLSCEHAISNLERRIADPEGFMEDEIRRTNKLKSSSKTINRYDNVFKDTDNENDKDSQISDPKNILKYN